MLPDAIDVLTACGLIFVFIMTVVATQNLWAQLYATLIIIGTVLGIIGAIVAVCLVIKGVLYIMRRMPEPSPRFESRTIYSSRDLINHNSQDPYERELRRRIEEEFDRQSAFGDAEDLV